MSNPIDEFCGSPFWDEQLTWNKTHPDLTPCFQATFLTWVPCAILWLLAPLECYFLKKSHHRTLPWTGAIIARILIALVLVLLCITNSLNISINQKPGVSMFAASLTSSILKALTFLFSIVLMLFNRKRDRHTSGILFVFWLTLTICEILKYRSAFIQIQREMKEPNETSFITHMIYFPLIIAELILSCIADVRRRHTAVSAKDLREESPEMSASFLSELTFWWFTRMSVLGWKRPLVFEDLWDLNPSDKTAHISKKFEKHCKLSGWSQTPVEISSKDALLYVQADGKVPDESEGILESHQKTPKIDIVKSLFKTFWCSFLVGSLWKLIFDLLQFLNPILLQSVIAFVGSDNPTWIGVAFACCMFLNGTLQSVILGAYFQRTFVLGMRIRSSLVTAIYKKSLLLSPAARKESTLGEIVNLMSVDSQRFMDLMTYLNLIWSAPLQIIIALVLLYQQLGPSTFAGLAVMVILIPFNLIISSQIEKRQSKQMKNKDERVKLISEVLNGIKVLKLYAWELAFKKKIDEIRNKEVKDLRRISYLNAWGMLMWGSSSFLVAIASFACYVMVDKENILDASTAFVSLSLFNILSFPLTMLPNLISILITSLLLSPAARKESTLGEIVNLMSVDSQRFMDLMTYLNLIWSAPLQIIIALVLLYQQLGPSTFAGLAVMVILIPFNLIISSQIEKRQSKQMKNKDERVKLISEVLNGIKVLKLYAWELAFKKKIDEIRNKEVKDLRRISYLNAWGMLMWGSSSFLVAIASFACYVMVDKENILDASTAFVSLSLFNILSFPLTMLPNLISILITTGVSVKRINRYMNGQELEKYVVWDSNQIDAIQVQDGTFSWSKPNDSEEKEIKPTLKSINLNVTEGSLVAVVGQVGSGKSSLLSAILGEMARLTGTVSINGKTALVSQQAWIQNSTLENNILFSDKMNKKLYNEVLEACELEPDLKILPAGDQTEIGEKGINLSGGQKQRVSLARAVYSNADIYLLDDPLSAVDSHVGKHIFEKVIGPDGLLKNKTRIFVTHGLTYLPKADIIYVINDGMIAEKGSYQELIDKKGPFAEFLSQYLQQVHDIDEDLEVLEDIQKKNPEFLRSLSHRSAVEEEDLVQPSDTERRMSVLSVNRSPFKRSLSQSVERSVSIEKSSQNEDGKLIKIETAETGKVKWSVYVKYMKSISALPLAIILTGHIIWQVFAVSSNIWLSEWGNDKPTNGSQDIEQRNFRLGVYGALGLGEAMSIFVGSFALAYGTLRAANVLHNSLLRNVIKSPMSFFDTTPLGRIVNRFAKDIDTLDGTILMTLREWLYCLLEVISTMIIICMQTPIFICVLVPLGIFYYFVQRFFVVTSRQLKRLESITRSPIYSHFSETLAGASTIRAYGAEERFFTQSIALLDNNHVCYYPSITANRWLAIRLEFCGSIIIFFTALLTVLERENLDTGKIGLSIAYALMVTPYMNFLVRMTSELETNIVAVERILEYTTTPTEAQWVVEDNRPPKEWPEEGQIVFENYSTQYRKGLDLVLKGISCNIRPAEKIGIVGRTGAGKSSFTLCLFRVIEAVDGAIDIDEKEIAELGLHDLRSRITIIPQDPVLFSGTLRMNLDPFNWNSDIQVWKALEHAHLKNFVSSLEAGLNHEIAEGGENLSVGQRQLVCLARALLRKTKILVLDEATAAVDLETDCLIQATIRKEFENASVLTIAHRLNTVMDYDRIMVLDKGEIAEFDAPSTLLKNKQSIFYGMAKDAGLV